MPEPEIDWLLANILDGISASNGRLALTVFCGSLAVSGTAVPEAVFLARIGLSSLLQATPQERQAVLGQRVDVHPFVASGAIVAGVGISDDEYRALHGMAGNLRRGVVDLVDVTILGAGPVPITAPAWRGRLSQISGWVPGLLG